MTEREEETPSAAEVMRLMLAHKPAGMAWGDYRAMLNRLIEAVENDRVVWYWDRGRDAWVLARITGVGGKDGFRVFDVDFFDDGPERWGYEWQVRPYSQVEPPAPDLSQVAP